MISIEERSAAHRRASAALPVRAPAPALRCAVLAWGSDIEGGELRWIIIFANGDETAARQAAVEWLQANPDSECQLMVAQPEGRARRVTRVEWGK